MSLTSVPRLFIDALTAPTVEGDAADIAIMEAAVHCVTRFGLERVTVEDVARAAGVGRATVFRRFESKDELIRRAFALELSRVVQNFATKVGEIEDPCDRLVELAVEAVKFSRTHPLGNRLIEDDTALSVHRDRDVAAFQLAGLREQVALCAANCAAEVDVDAVTEVLLRFLGSCWLAPGIGLALDDEMNVRRMIRVILAPVFYARVPSNGVDRPPPRQSKRRREK